MQAWAAVRGGFLILDAESSLFGQSRTFRTFVRYVGEFEGQAIVINAKGERSLVDWENCSLPPAL